MFVVEPTSQTGAYLQKIGPVCTSRVWAPPAPSPEIVHTILLQIYLHPWLSNPELTHSPRHPRTDPRGAWRHVDTQGKARFRPSSDTDAFFTLQR
ncbi:hypothetical protein PROPHIGD43A-1_7 [Mycobacterium phage prophiGD43A-1]|nr:hypothetical protein PROPHIGD43A-1_7 [Mycobacterium phage prophiGD43A-1]